MRNLENLLLAVFLLSPISFLSAQTPGNALHYNAVNGYVSSTLPTVFNDFSTNDFTIEAWINPETSTVPKRIFFAQLDANNFVSILLSSSNEVYVYINDNGTSLSVNIPMVIPTNQWTHFATSWDASANAIVCYINGVEENGIGGGGSSTGLDNIMTIGSRTDGSQKFKGSIDELRIWEDIRTPCEIAASLNSEFTTTQPDLVAYYNFNQGTAGGANTTQTTLIEFNGDYNGTLNGFLLTGATSNFVNSGADITLTNSNSGAIFATDVITACDSYTWIDGVNYTSSNNTATHVLTSASGCDSVVTLDLTINTVDPSISQSGTMLTANESGATYAWLDCNTMTIIDDENGPSYTPTTNGDYAAIVTLGNCTDTSTCVSVNIVGLEEKNINLFSIYPNPTKGLFHLTLNSDAQVQVTDLTGKVILNQSYTSGSYKIDLSIYSDGVYLVNVLGNEVVRNARIIKE